MRAVPKERVADYVEPKLSPASVERMWAGIEASGRSAPAVSRWWWLAAACVLLGAGLLLALRSSPSTAPQVASEPAAGGEPGERAEAWLATGAQPKTYPLGNGVSVELAPATQVRVERAAGELRLRLERGRVQCDVAAQAERNVVVHAGTAEMLTRQARFHVELEMRPELGPTLRVGVDAGRVAVQSQGEQLAALAAGQTWTNAKLADDAPTPTPQPSEPTARPAPANPAPTPAATPAASAVARSAAELLADAQRQRRAGDAKAAAKAYDRLRREYPGDARAGLAAFELARIRLDQLGDAAGALEAFDAALASGKAGFFAEDAAAGRVRALSKLGSPRCAQARADFLAAYPKSPHAAAVGLLCQAP